MNRSLSRTLLFLFSITSGKPPANASSVHQLHVSANRRYLQTDTGKPFFYLADTAWELFHRMSRKDTVYYLERRKHQGFNVIQAVLLAEFNGLTEPNAEGDLPLLNENPDTPNEAYFKHVDWVVHEAARRGIYIGMLPTWGDKVRKDWGSGPAIFNPENARRYGLFLGRRYRSHLNIIWILGGDRKASGQEAVWAAMAEGLRAGDGGVHLITYHPQGGVSSSAFWADAPWLDFNLVQSGHGDLDIPNYKFIAHDYSLTPAKPVIDGELRYENHHVNWDVRRPVFNDFDVRQGEYWSVFSGAAGATYGSNDVWQFLSPARPPINHGSEPWKQALEQRGAKQMNNLKQLMLSKDYFDRVPDQALLAANKDGAGFEVATRGDNYIFVYSPLGLPIALHMGVLHGETVRVSWFDPRNGRRTGAGLVPNKGDYTFNPPGSPMRGNDRVLILSSN